MFKDLGTGIGGTIIALEECRGNPVRNPWWCLPFPPAPPPEDQYPAQQGEGGQGFVPLQLAASAGGLLPGDRGGAPGSVEKYGGEVIQRAFPDMGGGHALIEVQLAVAVHVDGHEGFAVVVGRGRL